MSGCRMRGQTKNENISSTILLVTRGVKNLHNEALPNDLSVNMANNKFSDPRPRNQVECLFSEQWGRWHEQSEAGGVRSPRSSLLAYSTLQ